MKKAQQSPFVARVGSIAATFVALTLGAAACSSGSEVTTTETDTATQEAPVTTAYEMDEPAATVLPGSGTIEMTAKTNFDTEPFSGEFRLNEGAADFGCESGTYEDYDGQFGIDRTMMCEVGDREGTISIRFQPDEVPGEAELRGPWEVRDATGDFAGLTGSGDFTLFFATGAETLSGAFEYGPVDETPLAIASASLDRLNDRTGDCHDGFATTDGLFEFATVGDSILELDITTGEVADLGAPPASCSLWIADRESNRKIAVSPTGLRMWFGSLDGGWDTEVRNNPALFLMSRSLDANRAVFVTYDGTEAIVIDATTGEQVGAPIEGSFVDGRSFSAAAVSSDGAYLAIGAAGEGGSGNVMILNAQTAMPLHTIAMPSWVTSVAFASMVDTVGAGEELLVGDAAGTLSTIDPSTGDIIGTVETESVKILALGARPDGMVVVATERQALLVDRVDGPIDSISIGDRRIARIRADGGVVTMIEPGLVYETFDDFVG